MLHGIGMVSVLNGLHQDLAFYIPAVDVIVLEIPVSPVYRGLSDESGNLHLSVRRYVVDLNQFPGDLPAVHLIDHLPEIVIAGGVKLCFPVLNIFKRNIRMGQGQLFDKAADISRFRGRGFQKLRPGRRIVEQIPHQEGGAVRRSHILQPFLPSALNDIAGSHQIFMGFCDQLHLGNRRNAGEGLSPEPQGRNGCQILHLPDFAGGVAQKGQGNLVPRDAGTVVSDPDKGNSAALDLHSDGAGSRVDGIFHQLLHHGSRALHHLTGGNFVNGTLIQYGNLSFHKLLPL